MNNHNKSNTFAFYIALGRIIAMVCSFVMPIFLTRVLSKSDYGLYNQFYTLLGFGGTIFSFGIQSNLFYFYPTADENKRKPLVGNTLLSLFSLGVLSFLLLQIPFLNKMIIGAGEINNYFFIISICIAFYVPTRIIAPLFAVRKDKLGSVLLPPIEILLKLIIVVVAYLKFGTIKSIFFSVLILHFLLLVFTYVYSVGGFSGINESLFDFRLLKKQLSYAIPFGFAVVLNVFSRQFDKIVSISYLTTEEYATYSLAFFGIPGLMQIVDSISEVNLINMTKAYQTNQPIQMHEHYKDFCTKTLSFATPLILIFMLFSPELIQFLFSEKYVSSVPFFRIYLMTFFITVIGAGTLLRATGNTKLSSKAYLYSSIVCIPMTYIAIKGYGIWGAMISCMVSQLTPRIIQIYFENKIIGTNIRNYMPWKAISKIFYYSILCIVPLCIVKFCFAINIMNN